MLYKHVEFPSFIVNFSDCKGEFFVCFKMVAISLIFMGKKIYKFQLFL